MQAKDSYHPCGFSLGGGTGDGSEENQGSETSGVPCDTLRHSGRGNVVIFPLPEVPLCCRG